MHFTQSTSEAQKKFNNQNEGLFKTDLGIPANIQLNKNLRHDVRFILYEFFAFYSKCVRGTRRLIKKNIDFFMTDLGVPLTFLSHQICTKISKY